MFDSVHDEFKLPIAYQPHHAVSASIRSDLELVHTVDSSGTSVYSNVFRPSSLCATNMIKAWAFHFTDHVPFLTQSQVFFKKLKTVEFPSDFVDIILDIKSDNNFNMKYHYIDSKQIEFANTIPIVLILMTIYSMTSPLLFFLSPILMFLVPFVIIKMQQKDISWVEYTAVLVQVMKSHALVGLFTGFKTSTIKEQLYLIMSALFYIFQLYSNGLSCYSFYQIIKSIHRNLSTASTYMHSVITSMNNTIDACSGLSTYTPFLDHLNKHKERIELFYSKLLQIKTLSWSDIHQIGYLRTLYYELKHEPSLHQSLLYSLGLQGFVENIYGLQQHLNKTIHFATFGEVTKFKKAYYPLIATPVKNSYSLSKNYIITGPNASGKTTFVKTTLINVLLSQQIGCGYYKHATINPYQELCSYINIPDTSGRDSLFQAEARRCKEILDLVQHKRVFCIFDELFSGTNPSEASASAYAFLRYLSPRSTFMLTTHFIDICVPLQSKNIQNIHMKTTPPLIYSYKIKKGVSSIKGGVEVLKQLQYPTDIIQCAQEYLTTKVTPIPF